MSIRVLIVDDSVFMRSMLKNALAGDPDIEVLGTAMNGLDGLKKIKDLKPDVVTLDVEMPGLDGLQVLEKVMKECPRPIVMVSTKTQKGAQTTLDALQLGAVDYVAKPLGDKSATLGSFRSNIVRAVKAAAQSNLDNVVEKPAIAPAKTKCKFPEGTIIAIGISAGGPATLHKLIPVISKDFPPIVIAQHMPADFTSAFASRLDEAAQLTVKEASDGDVLKTGHVLIAPGNRHLRIAKRNSKLVATLNDGPKVSGFRPSVDVLFESVASAAGCLVVGLVMTGMGCDGAVGVQMVKKQGGVTIAQDQKSSIVYGMPKAAYDTGCVDNVVSLSEIPDALTAAVHNLKAAAPVNA